MEILRFKKAQFKFSTINIEPFLKFSEYEIVFVGRSNVGKSSLINFLTDNKTLARVSKTPGRTKTINFFEAVFDNTLVALIDLPGYGYANLSHSEKENISFILEKYLINKNKFKFIVHLLDSRRIPNDKDILLSNRLKSISQNYITVLTKIDKIPISKRQDLHKKMLKIFNLKQNECFQISTINKIGKDNLLKALQIQTRQGLLI